jgi:hypothetical protein
MGLNGLRENSEFRGRSARRIPQGLKPSPFLLAFSASATAESRALTQNAPKLSFPRGCEATGFLRFCCFRQRGCFSAFGGEPETFAPALA